MQEHQPLHVVDHVVGVPGAGSRSRAMRAPTTSWWWKLTPAARWTGSGACPRRAAGRPGAPPAVGRRLGHHGDRVGRARPCAGGSGPAPGAWPGARAGTRRPGGCPPGTTARHWGRPRQQLGQLVPDPLGRHDLQPAPHVPHGRHQILVRLGAVARHEPGGPQHAQRVVGERHLGRQRRAQHPRRQVGGAAERVDQLDAGQPQGHGVDGEVAPRQVLDDVGGEHDVRLAGVLAVGLGPVGRHLEHGAALAGADGAERRALRPTGRRPSRRGPPWSRPGWRRWSGRGPRPGAAARAAGRGRCPPRGRRCGRPRGSGRPGGAPRRGPAATARGSRPARLTGVGGRTRRVGRPDQALVARRWASPAAAMASRPGPPPLGGSMWTRSPARAPARPPSSPAAPRGRSRPPGTPARAPARPARRGRRSCRRSRPTSAPARSADRPGGRRTRPTAAATWPRSRRPAAPRPPRSQPVDVAGGARRHRHVHRAPQPLAVAGLQHRPRARVQRRLVERHVGHPLS